MRSNHGSLPGQLKSGLRPFYLLFGGETLLIEESLDLIRSVARDLGYSERIRLDVEQGFDWNQLAEHCQTVSLFAEKKLIELRLPTGRPGDAGAKALIDYADRHMGDETILLLVCGAIDKRAQNTKWFKAVDAAAVVVECHEIGPGKLPDWVSQRMSSKGMQYEFEAVERLCTYVEGNLLAAAQEINLLALLYPDEKISATLVEQVIADHARFTVFSYADACLAGSVDRVIRILQSLKREQAEPILVLWALARDSRIMCQLSRSRDNGENPGALFKKFGIWSNRSGIVNSALSRLNRSQWEKILRRIGRLDMMVKGIIPLQRRDIWEEIESVSLSMCNPANQRPRTATH